jgi:SAM-dependent methyltransferase
MAAGSASDGAIDVAIEEGEPESPKPAVKAPSAAPSSQRAGDKRTRPKLTLKIPDDEVARPQTTPSAPPARVDKRPPAHVDTRPPSQEPLPPAPDAPPMIPMRIITIEPPPVAAKPSTAPPAALPKPASVAPASTPKLPADDSWTPYQPTAADRAVMASPPAAAAPPQAVAPVAPLAPPRPRAQSQYPIGAAAPLPQAPAAPPRPSFHSSPSAALAPTPVAMPAATPIAPPVAAAPPPAPSSHSADSTVALPPAPPTERYVPDSVDEIPIVTEDVPPSSDTADEAEEDSRPTRPGVLKVPEPKLVPAKPAGLVPVAPAAPVAPPVAAAPSVEPASVHTAVTPVAAPVVPYVVPPVVPAAAAPAPAATPVALSAERAALRDAPPSGPIAPSPLRVASVPPAPAREQSKVEITDLPPMRALAPTEPEGLEVQFEDDEPLTSPARSSEPEAEIAPEDLVSIESAPTPSKLAAAALNPFLADAPAGPPMVTVGAPLTGAQPVRPPSVFPPSSAVTKSGAVPTKSPRVIVPTASALAPPPMGDSAPTGRRKVRPWWEELFNDDFVRTMAKITDAQIGKEVDFIEESLAVAKGAMLLDLACGTGRHAIELTRRGYKVVGFDLSLPMLAKAAEEAQDRNQKLNFVQGDMREMTFEDTFDGIYCWNTSFGFFEEDKNVQVVQRVHKALKKGGQFMLEVGNRDYIIHQAPSLAWFEGDGCVCMDEMSIDWITSRMKVKRTMMMDDGRTKEIDYSVRIYSLHELGKILHDAGFRVAEVSGRTGTPGVYFGNESPRTMILAEKK